MHPTKTAQIDQQLDLVGQRQTWISRFSEFCTQQTFWNSNCSKTQNSKTTVAQLKLLRRSLELLQVKWVAGLKMEFFCRLPVKSGIFGLTM
jgi:hypothetical protein